MRKLLAILFLAMAMLAVPATASANTVHVSVCDLTADTPTYSGATGIFVGHTDNCGTLGLGAAHYLQICAQYNGGAGWANGWCSNQSYANAPGQTLRYTVGTSCGYWFRVWAWAYVDWGGWTAGAVYSNASYRC